MFKGEIKRFSSLLQKFLVIALIAGDCAFNDSKRATSDVSRPRKDILLRKTKSFYNEDLTRQEKKTRDDDAEGRRRFFSDRNILSFSLFLSDERYPSLVKGGRAARIGKKGKTGHGDRTSPSLFGRVSDNTHTVWRVPKGIDLEALPPLSRFHPDSDANRGQLWRCVPSPYPRLTASTSIEITLIYCGTERLARSIIRLSPVGSCSKVFDIFSAINGPTLLSGAHCHLCVRRPADE